MTGNQKVPVCGGFCQPPKPAVHRDVHSAEACQEGGCAVLCCGGGCCVVSLAPERWTAAPLDGPADTK